MERSWKSFKDKIKEFGSSRPTSEIREEREEQKKRHQARRAKREGQGPKREEEGGGGCVPGPLRLRSAGRQTAIRAVQQQVGRDETRGREVWGRALKLNQRIKDLVSERAKEQVIANRRLESPFQVRKLTADQLCGEEGRLKGTIALAAIRQLWKELGEGGKGASGQACSSCDQRAIKQTMLQFPRPSSISNLVASKDTRCI